MPAPPPVNAAAEKNRGRGVKPAFNARPRRATRTPRRGYRAAPGRPRGPARLIGDAPRATSAGVSRPCRAGGGGSITGRFPHRPPPRRAPSVPTRPPRLRPLLFALGALPLAAAAVELGVRAYDSHAGGALSRPPCPSAQAVPCPLARHALPAHGSVSAFDPATGEPRACRVNSLGVRGEELAVPKPAGTVRVLILGDEAALAAYLPADETFAGKLRPVLARSADAATPGVRTEIVNAAVPGDCPLLSVLRLRTLSSLGPNLVLLCVRPSDLAEDARYRRDLLTDDAGRPVACPHPAFTRPGGCETGLPWWRRSLTVRLLARRAASCAAPAALTAPEPATELAADLALAPLAELVRIAAASGFRAAAVILPESPDRAFADDRPAAARVLAAAAIEHLPVYDAAAAFAALTDSGVPPGELVRPGGLLTAAGHDRLAAGLADFLVPPETRPGPPPRLDAVAPRAAGEPRPAAL